MFIVGVLFLTSSLLATAFVFDSRGHQRQRLLQISPSISTTQQQQESESILKSSSSDDDWNDSSNNYYNNKRVPVVAGNWKLNPSTVQEASSLLKLLASNFIHHRDNNSAEVVQHQLQPEVIVFPPFPFIERAVSILEGTGIKVGAQNVGTAVKGAFTGEVSTSMIRSLGCDYVMVGHSERRTIFDETDEIINTKIKLALEEGGLKIVLCVGESLEEYENELLSSVVNLQIKKALKDISKDQIMNSGGGCNLIIAYEPIWAIGTGKVATPVQAQMAHVVVRKTLEELYGWDIANQIQIQYGGSVTPDSIADLMSMADVDGALVGGASLTADGFTRIVDGASSAASGLLPRLPPLPPKELTALEVVSCKNVLGESPIWSVKDQALYWISAPEEEVWTWNLIDAPYRRLFGTTIGCIALRGSSSNNGGGNLLIAGERAFLETRMTQRGENMNDFSSASGEHVSVFCDRPEQTETTRPNDGRVDREGRLVIGMYNNYHRSGSSEGENNCGLYRLDPITKSIQSLFPSNYKYRVSNCISFSPDGRTLYFCDTPTRKVYAFDYPESADGTLLSNRRLIWTMPSNLPGGPDGAQVDADGGLWMAISGAGLVVRVHPSLPGIVDYVVHLPVKSPTSCTFGGIDLDELFITTRGPDGGGLYRVKMPFGIRGLPEPEFGSSSGSGTVPMSPVSYPQQQQQQQQQSVVQEKPIAPPPVYGSAPSYLDTL
jgi:triosephosphate isomerase